MRAAAISVALALWCMLILVSWLHDAFPRRPVGVPVVLS